MYSFKLSFFWLKVVCYAHVPYVVDIRLKVIYDFVVSWFYCLLSVMILGITFL